MSSVCRSQDQLIEECQGLVHSLAKQIHKKLPPHVSLEDLTAYGQLGLVEAAGEFDHTRGSRFSTYAYYRIRGAIYDGLSKMSWLSRAQYGKLRNQQMATEVLRQESETGVGETGGKASGGPLQADMRWFVDVSRALAVVYLATAGGGVNDDANDDGRGRGIRLEDKSSPEPQSAAMTRELHMKLRGLVDALPAEAAALIRATYFEGLTLKEAGRRLGISKSWASRLHKRTLLRLASALRSMDLLS